MGTIDDTASGSVTTGDQRSTIAEAIRLLRPIINVAQGNADCESDEVDAAAWNAHARMCREVLAVLEGRNA